MSNDRPCFEYVEAAIAELNDYHAQPDDVLGRLAGEVGRSQEFQRLSNRDVKKIGNKFLFARQRIAETVLRVDAEFRRMLDEIKAENSSP